MIDKLARHEAQSSEMSNKTGIAAVCSDPA
jgi:hypothetical protein